MFNTPLHPVGGGGGQVTCPTRRAGVLHYNIVYRERGEREGE